MSNLVWVYEKISSLSAASNEWTHEIDLLARYWADVASQSFGTPPQLEIYQAYRKSTAMIEAIPIRGNAEESPSSSSYISMIAYHLRHMFDHQNIGSQQAIYYGHRNYPYPLSLTNEGTLWAQRMRVYFQRLPDLVHDMVREGLGTREQIMSLWMLMMFRGMCWSRCHVLISGKTIPIQYCGSQLPVYLG